MSSDGDASSEVSYDSELGAANNVQIERIKNQIYNIDKRLKKIESRRILRFPKIYKEKVKEVGQENPMGTHGKKEGGKSQRRRHIKSTSRKTRNRRK